MTDFDDEFAAGAFPELLVQFGQGVTYRPRSGGTRAIDAIVKTNPLGLVGNVDDAPAEMVLVRVLNDTSDGIGSTELNLGGDKIDVPLRDGVAAQTLAIKRLASDSGGVLSLECY